MTIRGFAIQGVAGLAAGVVLAGLLTRYVAPPLVLSSGKTSGLDVPRVLLDTTTCDFGKVASGAVVEAKFRLSNGGRRRLILRRTSGRCQCILPDEPDIVIEPGQQQTIRQRLDTTDGSGPLQREWNYATNDPAQPLISFVGIAEVMPP